MTTLITFFLSNFTLSFLIISCLTVIIHLNCKRPNQFETGGVYHLIFSHFLFWNIGIVYFYNFVLHVFFSEMAASFIGWQDSPFQTEVGFASLSFAILGIIAANGNLSFRAASIIAISCFLWGAAGGHIYQMISAHNFSAGNSGVIFWTDLLIPLAGWLLLWCEYRIHSKKQS